jgi:hypothetical protein
MPSRRCTAKRIALRVTCSRATMRSERAFGRADEVHCERSIPPRTPMKRREPSSRQHFRSHRFHFAAVRPRANTPRHCRPTLIRRITSGRSANARYERKHWRGRPLHRERNPRVHAEESMTSAHLARRNYADLLRCTSYRSCANAALNIVADVSFSAGLMISRGSSGAPPDSVTAAIVTMISSSSPRS